MLTHLADEFKSSDDASLRARAEQLPTVGKSFSSVLHDIAWHISGVPGADEHEMQFSLADHIETLATVIIHYSETGLEETAKHLHVALMNVILAIEKEHDELMTTLLKTTRVQKLLDNADKAVHGEDATTERDEM